jgi:hypothetical protein
VLVDAPLAFVNGCVAGEQIKKTGPFLCYDPVLRFVYVRFVFFIHPPGEEQGDPIALHPLSWF